MGRVRAAFFVTLIAHSAPSVMQFKNTKLEWFLKSHFFSLLLFLFWGSLTAYRYRTLLDNLELSRVLWFVYNATISLLFLIRERPSVVSMNPIHWAVALLTSFSGYFFSGQGIEIGPMLANLADVLVSFSVVLGIVTALVLGRSYDLLPALRRVKTGAVYQVVRHPMYSSSIIIKIAYVIKNLSVYNVCLLLLTTFLYDRRARYEEEIMSQSDSYVTYRKQVKYRFFPGIY